MLLYQVDGIIRVFHDAERKLQIHEWLDYNPDGHDDQILAILQRIFELFIAYPVEKVLVDTRQTKGAFSPRILQYLREVQFPRLIRDTQLKYIATIKSKEDISQICTEIWEEELRHNSPMLMRDVRDKAEADIWFESLNHRST